MQPPNATAQWVASNWATLHPVLVDYLSWRLPVSNFAGLIEDHVQDFVTNLIEKDRLASSYQDVTYGTILMWAYHSACTTIRRWGVDGSQRASLGAKTWRETLQKGTWRIVQTAHPGMPVIPDVDIAPLSMNGLDYCDPSGVTPEDIVAEVSEFEYIRQGLLRAGRPDVLEVIQGLLNGHELCEYALLNSESS